MYTYLNSKISVDVQAFSYNLLSHMDQKQTTFCPDIYKFLQP